MTATVRNTGERDGAEVVQVYAELPADGQPPRRLVAFEKVAAAAGGSRQVSITVDPDATHHPLSVWSVAEHALVVPRGEVGVHVGTSSATTQQAGTITVG